MNTTENNTTNIPITPNSTYSENNANSGCLHFINQLNLAAGGFLWSLGYMIVDAVLLSVGIYYGVTACTQMNLSLILSIGMLACTCGCIFTMFIFFIHHWSFRHMTVSENMTTTSSSNGRRVVILFFFTKFIITCLASRYLFTADVEKDMSCKIFSFYLNIVCFSMWCLLCIIAPAPSLVPVREHLLARIVNSLATYSFYAIYVVVILFTLIQTETEAIECTFTEINDLYYHAPLQTFASFGLSLTAASFFIRVIFVINSDIYYRYPNLRRISTPLSVIIFLMSHLVCIMHLYYVSVGCILLFQPRSGGLCAKKAPKLYNTLYLWQIIQFFIFLIIPIAKILARYCGTLLAHGLLLCLPAHIAVPIFISLTRIQYNVPVTTVNENPPASPTTIDSLPMFMFNQVSDNEKFNQTSCTICLTDFTADEQIKRLPCDHIFHSQCVDHWLAVARVCPVCRQRVNSLRS